MARIIIKDLAKTFGAYSAVNGISLDISDGEFLILVGPSGCGKTTTLNMISGLETPTSGQIIIGNTVVNDLDPGERGLGMVFQDLALFPHMTVFENIAFGLRVKKVSDDQVRTRVRAAAAAVHIEALLDKLPRHCSGGDSRSHRDSESAQAASEHESRAFVEVASTGPSGSYCWQPRSSTARPNWAALLRN